MRRAPAARRAWAAIAVALLAGPVAAAPFAYVGNEKSGTVSVIDVAVPRVVGEFPAGRTPRAIASARGQLWITDRAADSLLRVDPATLAVTGSLRVGRSPEGVHASADGALLAVALEEDDAIAFVDTATFGVRFRVAVPGANPEHAVFSPDGRFVYVGAENAAQVDVVDVARRAVVATIAVGQRPRAIVFSPDGARAWVACELSDAVWVIDARRHQPLGSVPTGRRVAGLVLSADGRTVWASNGGDGTVTAIDAASGTVTGSVPVGQRPWNPALSPDGARLLVANGRSGTVTVVDTATRTVAAELAVGQLPWGVHVPAAAQDRAGAQTVAR